MGRPKTGNPPGRPSGTYGEDVMAVIWMEPGKMIRFRYATERETQSKYRCMRRAAERLGLDVIIHKDGHTLAVMS
jgi:hypothetical protein